MRGPVTRVGFRDCEPRGQVGLAQRGFAARAIMRLPMNDDRLLAIPAFRNFWLGRLAATAANQLFALVISWELYEITGSAWYLGMAGLLQFLPSLLSFIFAGDLADRIDRRRILVVVMISMTAMGLALLLASMIDAMSVWLLLTICLLLGLVRPFQMTAQQALPGLLVPPSMLARAVALSSAGSQAMFIVAPALGGLVLIAGAVPVYALCVLVCALAGVFFQRVRYEFRAPPARPRSLGEMLGGAAFIWRRPELLGSITLDLFVVLLASVTGLMPVFAKDVLQVDAWGLGLLRAAPAVGALVVSVALAHWSLQRHVGRFMFGGVLVFALSLIVFGLSTNLMLSLCALAVSGAADMISVVIRQTMVQIDTPDAMRGRVSAFNSVAVTASNQLGDFRCGMAAHWLGAMPAVVSGAVAGAIVTLLWIRWFPMLWRRQKLDQSAD